MASAAGKGFGTVNPNDSRGTVTVNGQSRKARINLIGGIIEDQSQTVGNTTTGGYSRNYNYDRRFKTGFTPPFAPIQENWETVLDRFGHPEGIWLAVGINP